METSESEAGSLLGQLEFHWNLPKGLLAVIGKSLLGWDLLTARSVSKEWSDELCPLVTGICCLLHKNPRPADYGEFLDDLSRTFPRAEKLSMMLDVNSMTQNDAHRRTLAALEGLAEAQMQVKHLELGCVSSLSPIMPEMMNAVSGPLLKQRFAGSLEWGLALSQALPKLQSKDIESLGIEVEWPLLALIASALAALSSLTELHFTQKSSRFEVWSQVQGWDCLTGLTGLQVLTITAPVEGSSSPLPHMADLTALTRLWMEHSGSVLAEASAERLLHLTNLKALILHNIVCTPLLELSALSSLTALELTIDDAHSAEDVWDLAASLSDLASLNLNAWMEAPLDQDNTPGLCPVTLPEDKPLYLPNNCTCLGLMVADTQLNRLSALSSTTQLQQLELLVVPPGFGLGPVPGLLPVEGDENGALLDEMDGDHVEVFGLFAGPQALPETASDSSESHSDRGDEMEAPGAQTPTASSYHYETASSMDGDWPEPSPTSLAPVHEPHTGQQDLGSGAQQVNTGAESLQVPQQPQQQQQQHYGVGGPVPLSPGADLSSPTLEPAMADAGCSSGEGRSMIDTLAASIPQGSASLLDVESTEGGLQLQGQVSPLPQHATAAIGHSVGVHQSSSSSMLVDISHQDNSSTSSKAMPILQRLFTRLALAEGTDTDHSAQTSSSADPGGSSSTNASSSNVHDAPCGPDASSGSSIGESSAGASSSKTLLPRETKAAGSSHNLCQHNVAIQHMPTDASSSSFPPTCFSSSSPCNNTRPPDSSKGEPWASSLSHCSTQSSASSMHPPCAPGNPSKSSIQPLPNSSIFLPFSSSSHSMHPVLNSSMSSLPSSSSQPLSHPNITLFSNSSAPSLATSNTNVPQAASSSSGIPQAASSTSSTSQAASSSYPAPGPHSPTNTTPAAAASLLDPSVLGLQSLAGLLDTTSGSFHSINEQDADALFSGSSTAASVSTAAAATAAESTAATAGEMLPATAEADSPDVTIECSSSSSATSALLSALTCLTSLTRLCIFDGATATTLSQSALTQLGSSCPKLCQLYFLGSITLSQFGQAAFQHLIKLDLLNEQRAEPFVLHVDQLPRTLKTLGMQNASLHGCHRASEFKPESLQLFSPVSFPEAANNGMQLLQWVATLRTLTSLTVEHKARTYVQMMQSQTERTPFSQLTALTGLRHLGVFFAESCAKHPAGLDSRLIADLAGLTWLEDLESWNCMGTDWHASTSFDPLARMTRLRSLKMEVLRLKHAETVRKLMVQQVPGCRLKLNIDNDTWAASGQGGVGNAAGPGAGANA